MELKEQLRTSGTKSTRKMKQMTFSSFKDKDWKYCYDATSEEETNDQNAECNYQHAPSFH